MLEKQLHGEGAPASEPVMTVVDSAAKEELGRQLVFTTPIEQPLRSGRWAWAEGYSVAAALAVLVLAAGLGEAWKSGREVTTAVASTTTSAPANTPADAALYLAPTGGPEQLNVSQNMNARLDTAVHGMESYYVNQLAERKAELSQLAPNATADWAIQLVDLDSSYQRLKRELPQHPQPEVVLTAMNRNLQIRLDILDQQLQLHAPGQSTISRESRAEYALADSRELSRNTLNHDR
jgi:hypothetical protein